MRHHNLVVKADFLVFDQARGLDLLGPSPSYEYMFAVNDGRFSMQNNARLLLAGELAAD